MNLQNIEKKIYDVINRIENETETLEKGTKLIGHAINASENTLLAATHVIDSFARAEQSLTNLKERVDAIDFPQYFSGLRDTIESLEKNIATISSVLGKAASDIHTSKDQILNLQEKVNQDISKLVNSAVKVDETIKELVKQVQISNQKSADLIRYWSEAEIPSKIKSLKEAIEQLIKCFEEVGFHQRLKDIEYSNVKLASEQDSIRKSIDTLATQQALLSQQLTQQKEANELARKEIISKLDGMIFKINIGIAIVGLALVGIGAILTKFLLK